ncbi:MAG: APC family permease [Myxococcales bacterium]|nr:APC family permease [Myxococcales bacterium]
MSDETQGELRRELGVRSSVLLTAGAMIGTGIFVSPIETARLTTSATAMLVVWALGAALSLLGALAFAEAGAAMPETGGLAVYVRRAFGDWAAFVFGWTMLVVLVPSSFAFFAQVAFWNLRDAAITSNPFVADAIVVSLVAANVLGLRAGAGLQNTLTVVKVLGIAAVGLAAAWFAVRGGASTIVASTPSTVAPSMLAAMVPVLWAYDGWIDITSVAGEVRSPRKTLPRAIVGGTLLVAALYLFVLTSVLAGSSHRALASLGDGSTIFSAGALSSRSVRPWLASLVAIASVGAAAVGYMSGVRVVFAVAKEGLLFAPLASVSRRGVPAVALIVCGAIAIAYIHSPLRKLGEVFVLGAWPFYALGALGVARLRARGAFDRGGDGAEEAASEGRFRTPLFPVPQVVFALVSVAIVAGYAVRDPRNTLISLGTIATGLVIYPVFRLAKSRSKRR